jgi:hypothetical protein
MEWGRLRTLERFSTSPAMELTRMNAVFHWPLDTSRQIALHSDQKVLMYVGEARNEGVVSDYMLAEMARIRMGELLAEASRARAAQRALGSRERGHYLGILALSEARRAEGGSFTRRTGEGACCA